MSDSLLPPNATDLELAVEKVLSRSDQIPIPIDTLWSAENAPENTLPWLAWALSVDEWSSDWSVETKRSVIQSSPSVHKVKGAVGAVRRAIASVSIDINLVEWWQQESAVPFTFRADVVIPESGISESKLTEVKRVVAASKNARSHLTHFRLTHEQSAGVFMTAMLSVRDKIQIYPVE
ncbi:phage tail protein I [Marinomonas atlantica]|uniref:phage tail protein I n=1 Tax=Marinomonas atlantica TaxID=1806668 RepID=UPI00082E2F02|nr:phage tail protein I [Marinomonas atlantica]